MPLRVKWIVLLRRIRIALITAGIVFGLTTIITFFYPYSDPFPKFTEIMLPVYIVGGIFLVVLAAFTIIKINDNKAREERLTWITNQLETPEGNENLEELRLAMLKYSLDSREKKCSICALELEEKALVVQCLRCDKIYHKEHFIEWLGEYEVCPNCKNLILPFD